MKARMIGKLEISAVGMGCMAFSHGYGQIPEESYSTAAIRAAADAGCTFFDTAEAYGQQLYWLGHNEQIIGNQPTVNELAKWAEAKGATPAQISMAWMLAKWPNVGRILENLGAADVELSAEEFAELGSALCSHEVFGHRGYVEHAGRSFLQSKSNR